MPPVVKFNEKFDLEIVIKRKECAHLMSILRDNELKFSSNEVCMMPILHSFTVYNVSFRQADILKIILKTAQIKTY